MNHQPSEIKDIPLKKFYPGIAWFFLVLTLICIPGYDLPKVDNWLIEINFDKFIHVGIFFVLAWLFMIPVVRSAVHVKEKWNWLIKITMASVIWGISTELIQKFFIPGRSFNLTDWAADGLGAIAALLYFKFRRGGIVSRPAK